MTTDAPRDEQVIARLRRAAAHPRLLAGPAAEAVDPGRVAQGLAAVAAELDAPREPRLARLLRRLGVPDRVIPIVTATPGLRRSWLVAVTVTILFAVNAAQTAGGTAADRIVVYLTVAPLVPLLGVALSFGPGVDPTHETVVAAPLDTFRVFLLRAATVLAASSLVLGVGAVLLPAGGAARLAWVLPSVACTATSLALAARVEPRRAAATVAVGWVVLVVVATRGADAATVFGAPLQVGALVLTAAALAAAHRRRHQLDTGGGGDAA